jgi:hypothetical protein
MAVSIIWSSSENGAALTSGINHGTGIEGDTLTTATIYLRHTGNNSIKNCAFYLDGTDVDEVIGWGDASGLNYGGFQIHMNANGAFPSGDWPASGDKSPLGLDTHTFRTGFGDTSANAITLSAAMGSMTTAGIIPPDVTDVHFQLRILIPATGVAIVGAREVVQKLRFTYTS